MVKKSIYEIIDKVIEALFTLRDEPFGISELASAADIKYETAKKILNLMEKLYKAGYLKRIKEKPALYMWLPERDLDDLLVEKFGQILLLNETLTIRELVEDYGLSEEKAEEILNKLVEKGIARRIDIDRIALKSLANIIKQKEQEKKKQPIPA